MGMVCSINELNLSDKNLTILPDLSKYTKLKVLDCSNNKIKSLDNLPSKLKELYCSNDE